MYEQLNFIIELNLPGRQVCIGVTILLFIDEVKADETLAACKFEMKKVGFKIILLHIARF